MASNVIPVRIAHGWAIAWLDLYQTPAVVSESVTSSIKVCFPVAIFQVLRDFLENYSGAKMNTRMHSIRRTINETD
jgi:hypothetical protein